MPPRSSKGSDDDAAKRPQDPLVERLRPDPSEPPQEVIVLEGLLGDSDREGYRRLYLTRALDYYAEFRTADVIDIQTIEPDQPPFLGEPASRVTLPRDAPVSFTRSAPARAADEFDLDVRFGGVPELGKALPPETWLRTVCVPCLETQPQTQCVPCLQTWQRTICVRPCLDTLVVTRCATQCGTCETCPTQCDTCKPTCATCPTECRTCITCDTCLRTRCDTCGIACTAFGCETQVCTLDTCGVACTRIGCETKLACTLDTCGIACTAVRCDTLVC